MKITVRNQMELFWWLPATCRALKRRRRRVCGAAAVQAPLLNQLCLDLKISYLNDGEDDDPLISAPMIHRVVSAANAEPSPIRTGGFVFDLASLKLSAPSRYTQRETAPTTRVERTDGIVRCVRILPQETDEWVERETLRRSKIIAPRPKKSVRTMSDKLSRMIGVKN